MVPSPDTEVEGVTTFSTSPATSYRYALRLKSDKLSIWMEDRTSKKQWYEVSDRVILFMILIVELLLGARAG